MQFGLNRVWIKGCAHRQKASAVQLVRDASGWYTGEIDGIPTMREGKVRRMEQWLAERLEEEMRKL